MNKRIENDQIPHMVAYFRDNYAEIAPLLVYAPRASKDKPTLEKKGANYGGAELILLFPNGGYSALCIQVLNASERNSDCHRSWRATVEHAGCKCVTIRSFLEFTEAVEDYLSDTAYA